MDRTAEEFVHPLPTGRWFVISTFTLPSVCQRGIAAVCVSLRRDSDARPGWTTAGLELDFDWDGSLADRSDDGFG